MNGEPFMTQLSQFFPRLIVLEPWAPGDLNIEILDLLETFAERLRQRI